MPVQDGDHKIWNASKLNNPQQEELKVADDDKETDYGFGYQDGCQATAKEIKQKMVERLSSEIRDREMKVEILKGEINTLIDARASADAITQ